MPRQLSDAEFVQFTTDYPQYNGLSPAFNMQPGQSAVVNWNNTGQIVLVYNAYDEITVNDNLYPDVYYTDVSDASQITALQAPGFSSPPQSMLDTLPQATKDTIAQYATQLGAMANSAGQALQSYLTAGLSAAGAGIQSLLSGLSGPLVIAAVILALIYIPRPRS